MAGAALILRDGCGQRSSQGTGACCVRPVTAVRGVSPEGWPRAALIQKGGTSWHVAPVEGHMCAGPGEARKRALARIEGPLPRREGNFRKKCPEGGNSRNFIQEISGFEAVLELRARDLSFDFAYDLLT